LVSQHVDPYQAMMAWRTQADFSGEDITDEEVEGWRSREVERVFSWEE
jgi:hypothetical protein